MTQAGQSAPTDDLAQATVETDLTDLTDAEIATKTPLMGVLLALTPALPGEEDDLSLMPIDVRTLFGCASEADRAKVEQYRQRLDGQDLPCLLAEPAKYVDARGEGLALAIVRLFARNPKNLRGDAFWAELRNLCQVAEDEDGPDFEGLLNAAAVAGADAVWRRVRPPA